MASVSRFNVPATYQTLTATADGAGGTKSGTWTDEFVVMLSIRPLTGFRRFEHAQIVKGNGYAIRTHYRYDITNKGRIRLFDGTELTIRSLVNLEMKNRELEIIADDGK